MLESGENDSNTVHVADEHTQSNSKKNQATTNTSTIIVHENTAHTGEETLQKSLRIESNNTNMESTRPENNRTSLNMIALAYNSDEEIDTSENKCDKTDELKTDDQSTIPMNQANIVQQYRTITVSSSSEEETDSENESISSSSKSSGSDKSSDSSDSDSDTITGDKEKNNKSKEKSDKVIRARKSRRKNELHDLPPIEDLQINVSEDSCHLFGEVDKIVEQMVIVKPQPDKPTLNLDTVLFLDKGQRTLGKIFDVFGSVSEPYYSIRFNNFEHIKQNKIEAGILVYYCPETEHTFLVFLHELSKIRGCDAVDDEAPEFSDDEEEQAYYQKLNQKNVSADSTADNSIPCKRQRMSDRSQKSKHSWQSSHPWNRNAQSQRDEKQLFPRKSNRFNRKYYNDRQQECAYQSNTYWHSDPHRTSNRLHPGYDMNQYYQGRPNFQIHDMHQYPRARYASGLSPSLINCSQFSNAPLSRNMVPYPTYAQLPTTHMTTPWPSPSVTRRLLSVPPPPGDSPPSSPSSSFSSLSSSVSSPSILPSSSSSSMFSLPPSTKTTASNHDTTRSN